MQLDPRGGSPAPGQTSPPPCSLYTPHAYTRCGNPRDPSSCCRNHPGSLWPESESPINTQEPHGATSRAAWVSHGSRRVREAPAPWQAGPLPLPLFPTSARVPDVLIPAVTLLKKFLNTKGKGKKFQPCSQLPESTNVPVLSFLFRLIEIKGIRATDEACASPAHGAPRTPKGTSVLRGLSPPSSPSSSPLQAFVSSLPCYIMCLKMYVKC